MNVYEKSYHPEFIASLPVNFKKIKSIDLSSIPEKFHCLFKTDWNWGRYSSMKMSERAILADWYLVYKKWKADEQIHESKEVVGFPD